jgi:hypothetical protein
MNAQAPEHVVGCKFTRREKQADRIPFKVAFSYLGATQQYALSISDDSGNPQMWNPISEASARSHLFRLFPRSSRIVLQTRPGARMGAGQSLSYWERDFTAIRKFNVAMDKWAAAFKDIFRSNGKALGQGFDSSRHKTAPQVVLMQFATPEIVSTEVRLCTLSTGWNSAVAVRAQ